MSQLPTTTTPPTCKRCGGPMLLLDGEWECHNVAPAIAPTPNAQAKCPDCAGPASPNTHNLHLCNTCNGKGYLGQPLVELKDCGACNGTGIAAPPSAQAREALEAVTTRETNKDAIGVDVRDEEGVWISLASDDSWHWISLECARDLYRTLRHGYLDLRDHTDDIAVDKFADAMKAKLAKKRGEGRGGWDDPAACSVENLAHMLIDHVPKGDTVDIGNFAMMLFNRGCDATLLRSLSANVGGVAIPLGTITPAMVHKMCHYLNGEKADGNACAKCPAVEKTPYGDGERGCYGIAFETLQMARCFMYEGATGAVDSQWVAVTERMPTSEGRYLVSWNRWSTGTPIPTVTVSYFRTEDDFKTYDAWRDLPPAYAAPVSA